MFLRYNVFALGWMLLILLLTLTPGENMPQTGLWEEFLNFDKVVHLSIFGAMVFLLIISLSKQYTFLYLRRHAIGVSVATGILYGILIELIQNLIPGRSFEFADVIANSLGCLTGYGIFFLVYKL